MLLVVIAGFILAVTPFVAEKFFPVPENTLRVAKPEAASRALKQWFDSPDALFSGVQAISKSSIDKEKNIEKRTSWFAFSVGRRAVEKYIIKHKLQQTELSDKLLKEIFYTENRPASWWQPEALSQKTFFSGEDQGRKVALIYNPDSKRGVLVTHN